MTSELQIQSTEVQTPMALIAAAVQGGVDPAGLEKLMDLQDRWDQKQARVAYNQAMAAFQSSMLTIYKGRENKGTRSQYASFDDIMRVARPELARHGLAVTFSQSETAETITVVCKVIHKDGHSEESPFTLPKDEVIKSKEGRAVTNRAQAQGSANSYAKRYALVNALNIVLGDQDDDAQACSMPEESVTKEQANELLALIKSAEITEEDFSRWSKCDSVANLPKRRFAAAVKILNDKIARNQRKETHTEEGK